MTSVLNIRCSRKRNRSTYAFRYSMICAAAQIGPRGIGHAIFKLQSACMWRCMQRSQVVQDLLILAMKAC